MTRNGTPVSTVSTAAPRDHFGKPNTVSDDGCTWRDAVGDDMTNPNLYRIEPDGRWHIPGAAWSFIRDAFNRDRL